MGSKNEEKRSNYLFTTVRIFSKALSLFVAQHIVIEILVYLVSLICTSCPNKTECNRIYLY